MIVLQCQTNIKSQILKKHKLIINKNVANICNVSQAMCTLFVHVNAMNISVNNTTTKLVIALRDSKFVVTQFLLHKKDVPLGRNLPGSPSTDLSVSWHNLHLNNYHTYLLICLVWIQYKQLYKTLVKNVASISKFEYATSHQQRHVDNRILQLLTGKYLTEADLYNSHETDACTC